MHKYSMDYNTKDYMLNSKELDDQHLGILTQLDLIKRNHIGSFVHVTEENTVKKLEELQKSWQRHCIHEEYIMRKHNYPHIEAHVASHKLTNGYFGRLKVSLTASTFGDVITDLLKHIDVFDRAMVNWFTSKNIEINSSPMERKQDS
jgi:hemerythrin